MQTAGFEVSFSHVMVTSKMLLLLTFLFGGVLGAWPESCPPEEDVLPCSCRRDHGLTFVTCTGLDNLDMVRPVLKSTRWQMFFYSFSKSRLGNIPSNFFEGQQSPSLAFDDCQIGSFGDRPFSGLDYALERLYISTSIDKRIQDLEVFPLGHLKKLEYLFFSDNAITKVPNDWFEGGPEKLKLLYLIRNDIDELGDQAFASLANLKYIYLDHNPIKKVSRYMFPSPAKLKELSISSCDIEELPEDIFEGMPDLKEVDVSGNRLKTIPYTTWGKLWDQLDKVNFDKLDLECDYRMKWIYQQELPKELIGSCGGNNKLRGKKLSELRLEDFE